MRPPWPKGFLAALSAVLLIVTACAAEGGTTTIESDVTTIESDVTTTESDVATTEADVTTTPPEDGELTSVSFRLDFIPTGRHIPFFLALDRGYYEEEGLDVTIGDGSGSGPAIQAVAGGGDDFGYASVGAVISAVVETEVPIISVGVIGQRVSHGMYYDADLGVSELADMCGRDVLLGTGSADGYLTEMAMEANGLDPSCINYQTVDTGAKVRLYVSGESDGVVTTATTGDAIIQPGRASGVFRYYQHGVDLLDYSLITSLDTVESNPELVLAFVRATIRGWEAAVEDPSAAVEALLKHRPDSDAAQVLDGFEQQIPLLHTTNTEGEPIGCDAAEDWETTLDLLGQYADIAVDSGIMADGNPFHTREFVPGC